MRQIYGLTDAELPVLAAISEGPSAREIVERLGLSVATVRSQIPHI